MITNNFPVNVWVEPDEKANFKAMFLSDGHMIRLSVRAEMEVTGNIHQFPPIKTDAPKKLMVKAYQEIDSTSFELSDDGMIGMIFRKVYENALSHLKNELKDRHGIDVLMYEDPSPF